MNSGIGLLLFEITEIKSLLNSLPTSTAEDLISSCNFKTCSFNCLFSNLKLCNALRIRSVEVCDNGALSSAAFVCETYFLFLALPCFISSVQQFLQLSLELHKT